MMRCECCGEKKPDVCEREDGYARDINDEADAMWVACDDCDQQNNDDI